tara:strand:+ start:1119 stop:1343 length:225 start_codon:yes stop_codon:yes gene_type:complete
MTERVRGKFKTTGLIPIYGVKTVDGKKVKYIKYWSEGDLSKKNKSTKSLTEKSDKPYGQPEKAKKKKQDKLKIA